MVSERKKIYILLFTIIPLLSVSPENIIYAQPSMSIFDMHNLIACGKIIAKDEKGYEKISGPIYTIAIEHYYKGHISNTTLTSMGSEDSNGQQSMPSLDVGQRAMLYVDLIGENFYILTPHTAKVPKCDTVYVPTPLGQYRFGINAQNVYCVNETVSIIKNSDGSPACVTPETKHTLIERGWAKSFS